MSGITLVSANPGLEHAFLQLYGKTTSVRRVWSDQWRDPVETAMDVCAADPELLVVGGDVIQQNALALIPEVDRRFPRTTILALVQARDPHYAIELLRLGARDVLDESSASAERRHEIDRVLDIARARRHSSNAPSASPRRRVITVLSPKGGTGKTTVATNLAVGLAGRRPNQALVIDLDLQFGDCAAALGLRPEYSLIHAVASPANERSGMKVFLTAHSSGLALLPPPDDLALADDIEPDDIKRVVSAMTEEFPFVVIDTAGGIDRAALAAMEFSTDLLLVSTTDVPSIRALRRQLDALDQVGYVSQRRTFLLNRANAKVGLSVGDVESAVGLEATFQLPSTRAIPLSTNEGVPVIVKDSGQTAKRFEELVEHFAPQADDDRARPFRRGRRKAVA